MTDKQKIVGAVIYSTKSGLGILAKQLYDAGIIDKVFIAENKKFEAHIEWYKLEDICVSRSQLIKEIDTLLIIEAPMPNPFDWGIATTAKYLGKRVVLMPMYESTPRLSLNLMDHIICPSLLDLEYYRKFNSSFIQVPSQNEVVWGLREHARIFVHNVGHGGIFSRNGTAEIIRALPMIKATDIKIVIRIQPDADEDLIKLTEEIKDPRVEVVTRHVPFDELWGYGDVFLFPEKFNGLSLPLQEAHAAGMLVMAGDRFPINTWLPKPPLIKVSGDYLIDIPWIGINIKSAVIKPEDIAKKVDNWAGQNIEELSLAGKKWARENSADKLKGEYDKVLR